MKERSTGTITLGAGYGSVQKFFLTSTISEINLFGRANWLALRSVRCRPINDRLNLGFTDPYAFDSSWSLGCDLFTVNLVIPNRYATRKLGFDVRAGYPLEDFINGYITYKFEGLQIVDYSRSGFDSPNFEADIGVLSSVVWSVIRDHRNNRFETTDGTIKVLRSKQRVWAATRSS